MLFSHVYEIPQWGSVTAFELAWTIIGAVTVLFVLPMLLITLEGYIVTHDNTIEKYSALQYVRREAVRLFQGLCILGVGVYVDFQGNPVPGPAYITVSGIVIITAIFLIALGVIVQSFLDWRIRTKIIAMLERGDFKIENSLPR